MIDIHIRDSNFFSEQYPERPHTLFNWVWDRDPVNSDITVFSDCYIREAETSASKVKIAWLIEPPVINSFIYDYVLANHNLFDLILTFDESLLGLGPKVKYYPYGTTWIVPEDRKIWAKDKLISAVFSDKNFTEGHNIRHEIFSMFKNDIDFFGAMNNNRIEHKVDGHKDYYFSIIVENWTGNSYFSEKLLDCLLTGTIPIYRGFPKSCSVFDPNGFIYFNDSSELQNIIPHLNREQYESRLEAVRYNFEKALEFIDLEKSLWLSCFKDLVNK